MDSNGDGFERCEALESCPVKGLKCAQWRLTPSLRGLFWGLPGGGRGVCGVWGCKECESTKIHEVKAVFLPFLVHFGGVSRQGEFKNVNFFRKKSMSKRFSKKMTKISTPVFPRSLLFIFISVLGVSQHGSPKTSQQLKAKCTWCNADIARLTAKRRKAHSARCLKAIADGVH
jgi:hypothetical protein